MEIIKYHKNGEIHHSKEYIDDDTYIYRTYYKNGQIEMENTYHFNYKKCMQYYINGKLELECSFIDEEYDGIYTSYYEDGEIMENIYYEKGIKKITILNKERELKQLLELGNVTSNKAHKNL